MTSLESLTTLAVLCKYISKNHIEGDVVETGVWRGGSALVCARYLRSDQTLYLLDTYAGMTEPSVHDFRIGENDNLRTIEKWHELQEGQTSRWVKADLKSVKDNFGRFKLLSEGIVFIEGKVEETIPKMMLPKSFALIRIDTDFYSSTKIALETFWPRLRLGGFLILDDYAHWDGARRATDEYFKNEMPLMIPLSGGGGRLIIKSDL